MKAGGTEEAVAEGLPSGGARGRSESDLRAWGVRGLMTVGSVWVLFRVF